MAALQIGRDGRDVPRSIRSDGGGLRQKVGQHPPIDLLLPHGPLRQQIESALIEGAVQLGEKPQRGGGQHFQIRRHSGARNGDALGPTRFSHTIGLLREM
jgi:hypothetical protein